jgi:hypothetical protein
MTYLFKPLCSKMSSMNCFKIELSAALDLDHFKQTTKNLSDMVVPFICDVLIVFFDWFL